MTGPLKLRARERLCSCQSCKGLSEGELGERPLHHPVEQDHEKHSKEGDESELANVDIVSTSTSASPMSSPRTDATDSSGEPQHVAVDEAYWSPFSGPASTAYASPYCPPEVMDVNMMRPYCDEDLCNAMAQHCDPSSWDTEEFFLPPGLCSPGDMEGFVCGATAAEGLGEDLGEMGEMGGMGAFCGSEAFSCMGLTAADFDYSQYESMPTEEDMKNFMQWQQQHHDHHAMGHEMWPDPLAERLHFDKLTRAAFGSTMEFIEGGAGEDAFRTTVMIRNLPNTYSRDMLLELLDDEGFAGRYDFVYLPIDFTSSINLGYAFIDLVSPADAHTFMDHFTGFSKWSVGSDKVCVVSWSSPHQGLEQHVERYRSSPVMHPNIPEDWKPLIFLNAVRVAFPPPLKHIKAPKVRSRPEVATTITQSGHVA